MGRIPFHKNKNRRWACVITMNELEWYSSFFDNATDAIVYAERHPGVTRVEEVHYSPKEPEIVWQRQEEQA